MRRGPVVILLLLILVGCSRRPGGVLSKEEMAQLLADIHTAEAVIEINRSSFNTDSARRALRQAVYERHGVTQLMVDSSFVWYGRNIDKYMDVYDRTIEILDHRNMELGSRLAEAALSIAGDSVDVWPGARFFNITDRSPSSVVTFSFPRDANWERGDIYTWRAKIFNNQDDGQWGLVTEYADGMVEFYHNTIAGDGWHELAFVTDSNRVATRIYGYMSVGRRPGTALIFDSIAMVRKRVNPDLYSRRYMYRKLPRWLPEQKVEELNDSIPADGRQ